MQQEGKFILFDDVSSFTQWLNNESISRKVTHVQLHCTDIPRYKDFNNNNHFSLAKAMEKAHSNKGWDGIGQNITIYPDGRILVCRNFSTNPACISGHNKGGLCIENVGLFDKGADTMTVNQKNSIVGTTKAVLQKFSLKPETDVVYHAWHTNLKTCPGTDFFGGNKRADYERNLLPLLKGANTTSSESAYAVEVGNQGTSSLYKYVAGISLLLLVGAGFVWAKE